MMPQFTPTHLFSALCPSFAIVAASQGRLPTAANARAVAISSAAEEERPAPSGTSPASTPSQPESLWPASARLQAVPLRYSSQPSLVCFRSIEGKFLGFVVIDGMHDHLAVVARLQGDPHGAIDGQRQHETVVVVGMLADQIHPAGRTDHQLRLTAETLHEMLNDFRFSKRHGMILLRNMIWIEDENDSRINVLTIQRSCHSS